MSPSPVEEHRAAAPARVGCAVLTVSDTRTLETDAGGKLIAEMVAAAGHTVAARAIVPDERLEILEQLNAWVGLEEIDALLITGGTGISQRDTTVETLAPLFRVTLPGYGELFRALSFHEIGPAAMLSRAEAGLIGGLVVFTMPGSPNGVRLAMEKLILPELGHLVREARK